MPVTYPHTTVRIEQTQYDRLKNQATRQGISITCLVASYIEWGLENDLGASPKSNFSLAMSGEKA